MPLLTRLCLACRLLLGLPCLLVTLRRERGLPTLSLYTQAMSAADLSAAEDLTTALQMERLTQQVRALTKNH